jgi:hypothetical protein
MNRGVDEMDDGEFQMPEQKEVPFNITDDYQISHQVGEGAYGVVVSVPVPSLFKGLLELIIILR